MARAKRWGSALAGVALTAVAVAGCGGGEFTAQGVIHTWKPDVAFDVGENCDANITDFLLKGGLTVKIKAEGSTVAMGKLESGEILDKPVEGGTLTCAFEFSVPDVPAGKEFYTIDLGEDHGHMEFTEEEIRSDSFSADWSQFEGRSEQLD